MFLESFCCFIYADNPEMKNIFITISKYVCRNFKTSTRCACARLSVAMETSRVILPTRWGSRCT